jgi:hypothetical protein
MPYKGRTLQSLWVLTHPSDIVMAVMLCTGHGHVIPFSPPPPRTAWPSILTLSLVNVKALTNEETLNPVPRCFNT